MTTKKTLKYGTAQKSLSQTVVVLIHGGGITMAQQHD